MTHYKAVFHIDEMSLWDRVLGNTQNLLNAMKDQDLTVAILANGEAVRVYIAADQSEVFKKKLQDLSQQVRFKACRNALNAHKIDPSVLSEFVEVVPAGVAELVLLQHDGYAYIKP